ncbi:hypothetical protein CCP3SC15_300033 [Gammaproteobacteria bacterium]
MIGIVSMIIFATLFVAATVYAMLKTQKAGHMIDTARRVISRAESLPRSYISVTACDFDNPEHIAKISEAAANQFLRAMLVRLREEAYQEIQKGAAGDIGNRAFGRIEAYNGINAALDIVANKYQKLQAGAQ